MTIHFWEVQEAVVWLISEISFWAKKKKTMSDNLDFTQYTLVEKENIVKNLMVKQVDLARFLSDSYRGQDVFLNFHLMFLILVKHSNFYQIMVQKTPNRILTKNEFAVLIADELENYVDHHINNN